MASRPSWQHVVLGGVLVLTAWQGQWLLVPDNWQPMEDHPAHISLAGGKEKRRVLIVNTGGTFLVQF